VHLTKILELSQIDKDLQNSIEAVVTAANHPVKAALVRDILSTAEPKSLGVLSSELLKAFPLAGVLKAPQADINSYFRYGLKELVDSRPGSGRVPFGNAQTLPNEWSLKNEYEYVKAYSGFAMQRANELGIDLYNLLGSSTSKKTDMPALDKSPEEINDTYSSPYARFMIFMSLLSGVSDSSDIADVVHIDSERVDYHLSEMRKQGYVNVTRTGDSNATVSYAWSGMNPEHVDTDLGRYEAFKLSKKALKNITELIFRNSKDYKENNLPERPIFNSESIAYSLRLSSHYVGRYLSELESQGFIEPLTKLINTYSELTADGRRIAQVLIRPIYESLREKHGTAMSNKFTRLIKYCHSCLKTDTIDKLIKEHYANHQEFL